MDVRNCKKCGALFNYSGYPICPKCNKEMEDKFVDVRNYLRENPNSNIAMVSDAVEVPVQQIKKWIREERLTFTKESGVVISCENCGGPIMTGRYCNACKKTMTNKFEGLYVESPQEKKSKADANARMRFISK